MDSDSEDGDFTRPRLRRSRRRAARASPAARAAPGYRKRSIVMIENSDRAKNFAAVWKFMGSKSPDRVVTDEDREMVRELTLRNDNFADDLDPLVTSKHCFCLMLMAGRSAEHKTQSGVTYRYSRDIKHFIGPGKFLNRSDFVEENRDRAVQIALMHVETKKEKQSVGNIHAVDASDAKWLKHKERLAKNFMCAFDQYCELIEREA